MNRFLKQFQTSDRLTDPLEEHDSFTYPPLSCGWGNFYRATTSSGHLFLLSTCILYYSLKTYCCFLVDSPAFKPFRSFLHFSANTSFRSATEHALTTPSGGVPVHGQDFMPKRGKQTVHIQLTPLIWKSQWGACSGDYGSRHLQAKRSSIYS